MNIDNIRDEYKKVFYMRQLELYIDDCIKSGEFLDIKLSNYVIVIRQSYSKTDIEYNYIDDIESIKGYLLECFKRIDKGFKTYNYDGFNYDDLFLYYRKMLFDTTSSDVYLKFSY